tara:strand:- start:2014 stop:2220 length:207 start_codon:yes stop_codon:yes gene_type:complete
MRKGSTAAANDSIENPGINKNPNRCILDPTKTKGLSLIFVRIAFIVGFVSLKVVLSGFYLDLKAHDGW